MRFLYFLIFPLLTAFTITSSSQSIGLSYVLNPAEERLAKKYPLKMFSVGRTIVMAQKHCLAIHGFLDRGDASDACRHFFWSALLYKEFGLDFSQQVLNAHEEEEDQHEEDKKMDLANNQRGLNAAAKLAKENKLNVRAIRKSYYEHRRFRRLVIIKE